MIFYSRKKLLDTDSRIRILISDLFLDFWKSWSVRNKKDTVFALSQAVKLIHNRVYYWWIAPRYSQIIYIIFARRQRIIDELCYQSISLVYSTSTYFRTKASAWRRISNLYIDLSRLQFDELFASDFKKIFVFVWDSMWI